MEYLEKAMEEDFLDGTISESVYEELLSIYQEGMFGFGVNSPLVMKMNMISAMDPGASEGTKEIKQFVNKYKGAILKCSQIMQREPDKLDRFSRATFCACVLFICAGVATFILSESAAMFGFIPLLLSAIVVWLHYIIRATKISRDLAVMPNLERIRATLKRIPLGKLPNSYRKEIIIMVTAIDDAQRAIDQMRVSYTPANGTFESTMDMDICNAFCEGKISMDEMEALYLSLMEGTNWDIHKEYKERIKKTKESIRAIKKFVKEKEYDKARDEIKDAKLNLKEAIQDLEKIESDVWHSIIGYFMINVRVLVKSFLLALIPISTPIAGVYVLFKEFERTFKNYKKNGKLTADDLNVYKNMCISELQAMITTLENIEKKIDADEKLEEEQDVKESLNAVVIDDIAFAFLEGAIDLDDANDLIEMMEAHSEPSRSQLNVEFQKNAGEIKALEEKLAELKKSSTLKDVLKARLAKRQILDTEKQLKKVKDRNSEITKMIKDKDHKFGNWNRQMMHNYNQWHQQEIQRQMHQDMITQQHIQAHNDMVNQHNMMHQQAVQNHIMMSTPGMGFGF